MVQNRTPVDAAAILPAEVTSFVGRRLERSRVKALLGDSRLVTLTGFGGVGKTRLAVRVASELRRAFSDGVYFASLGAVIDPDWVPETVAQSLGLQGGAPGAAPSLIAEYLRTRSVLLVMDNCEHVVDEAAMLADVLLRTSPKLRIIATSREPLRIAGEVVESVAPLAIPLAFEHSGDFQCDSVTLFVDRAKAAVPTFVLTQDNLPAVQAICRKLEGIPLAIELAASRLRAMSPREIDEHMTGHWELLSRGSRTAPQRQQTMAACIEWSFGLCTQEERDLWARASIFSEGFDLSAATDVCMPSDRHDPIADILLALVEKSIVMATDVGPETRFRMLPPIQQRGVEVLRSMGQLGEQRRRHRDWCIQLMESATRDWVSPRQLDWIAKLRRESANLSAALEFSSVERGQSEQGLVLGSFLIEFAISQGLFKQGREQFEALLSQCPEAGQPRANALRAAGWWAAMQGDPERGAALLREAAPIVESLDGRAATLHVQLSGLVALLSGDLAAAISLLSEAIDRFASVDDQEHQAPTLNLLALAHLFGGDHEGALAAVARCNAITRPADECFNRSHSLWIEGLCAWVAGDEVTATSLQQESLRCKRLFDDSLGIGLSLEALSWLASQEDPHRAGVLTGAAQAAWERSGSSTTSIPGINAFHDECMKRLDVLLGGEGLARAIEQGRRLDQEEAVALAVGDQQTAPVKQPKLREGPAALTRRETEVATLVGEGLSNKEIADRLVISKRTAETHVEHILTKLGLTNRTQIRPSVEDDTGQ